MQIVSTCVSRRNSPPGAGVEFTARDGGSITVELRGTDFAGMTDAEIVARARAGLGDAARSGSAQADAETGDIAGLDQTLDQP